MRNFFSHWRILLALLAAIALATMTLDDRWASAEPTLEQRLRQHVLSFGANPLHYAETVLAAQGYRVRRHATAHGSSIEASLANVDPGLAPEQIFVVGNRYDPAAEGIDASLGGAAAVLELARILHTVRPASGTAILFVLFAAPQHPASTALPIRPGSGDGSFIAFIGPRAGSAAVRQALAAFRDDAGFLAPGLAAPCYQQALTLAAPAIAGGSPALLFTATGFTRYPYFSTAQHDPDPDYESMARVVGGLARTLAALAAARAG